MFFEPSKTSLDAQEIITFSKCKTIIRNGYNTSSKIKKSNYYIQMHAFPFTLKTSKRRAVMKNPANIYLFRVNNRTLEKEVK